MDLDGHTLTTTSESYVIENYGELEIVDLSEDGTGKITSTTNTTIYNGSPSEDDGTGEGDSTDNDIEIDLRNVKPHSEEDEDVFQYDETTGKIINNNQARLNTIATGYIELDLSQKEGKYTLEVDSTISARNAYAYVTLTNEPDPDVKNTSYARFISIGGGTKETNQVNTIDLAGGQKYYMNLRFDRSSYNYASLTGTFTINSIKLKPKPEGKLTLTSGTIEIDKEGSSSSLNVKDYSAIENKGMLNIKGGTITSSKRYTSGIATLNGGNSNIQGGEFNLTGSECRAIKAFEKASLTKITDGNIYAYYGVTSHDYTGNVIVEGGNFNEECTYQIWNQGTCSRITLKNVTLKKGANSGACIYNNTNYCETIINHCNISNEKGYCIYNYSRYEKIEIKDSNITGRNGIYNYRGYNKISVNSSTMETANESIQCDGNGILDVVDCTINSTNSTIISALSSSTVTIKNSKLSNVGTKNSYTGINIYSGTLNIIGDKTEIKTSGSVISNSNTNNNLEINIESGKLEPMNSNVINIGNAVGNINLGTNDDEVNEELPMLKSNTSSLTVSANKMQLNFYDGQLIGVKNDVMGISVKELVDEYEIINEKYENDDISNENEFEVYKLGKTLDVVELIENGEESGQRFDTIQQAVEECKSTDSQSTIKLLKDINLSRQIGIKPEQNIKIDLNSHKIDVMTDDAIKNEGTLELTDDTKQDEEEQTDYNISTYSSNSIIYNTSSEDKEGELTINKGIIINYNAVGVDYNNCKQVIKNEGILNINDVTINTLKAYVYGINNTGTMNLNGGIINTKETYSHAIYDNGTKTSQISNTKIKTNVNTSYGIYNNNSAVIEINEGTNITTITSAIYNKGAGEIKITGGEITNSYSRTIYNESTGKIDVSGGTISAKDSRSSGHAINNNASGIISISGGNITSISYCISNNNSKGIVEIKAGNLTSSNSYVAYNYGTMKITGGTLESKNSYGVYNNNTGALYLGEKIPEELIGTDEEPSITNPNIKGKTSGVYNNKGSFYFYDGAITGTISKSIDGNITDKEDGYQIYIEEHEDNTETSTLRKISVIELYEKDNEEKIEDFATVEKFQTSLNELTTDKEYLVKIVSNFAIGEKEEITIPDNLKVTLDINGYTISSAVGTTIKNNGTLTIIDSNKEAPGALENGLDGANNANTQIISNAENATLKIESGVLTTSGAYGYAIYNHENGTVDITGGTIITQGSYGYGIYNEGNLDVKDNGITTNGSYSCGIYNNSEQSINITSSKITITNSGSNGIFNNNTGEIQMDGVNISATSSSGTYGVHSKSDANIHITGGEINTSGTSIYNENNGTIEIDKSAKITNTYSSPVIVNSNTGTIQITDSTITSNATRSSGYGIRNDRGTVNLLEGSIVSSYNYAGIYNGNYEKTATVNIKGGTITSKESYGINNNMGTVKITEGKIISEKQYGIYNRLEGTLEIGEKLEETQDGEPSTDSPSIKGATYGIYNEGIFNFYDGQIIGDIGKSINYNITDKEPEYQIKKVTDDEQGVEIATLEKRQIMSVDGQPYYTISEVQNAIDNMGDKKTYTIELLSNTYMSLSECITIAEDSEVTIDLKGNFLETSSETAIANEGNLTITDTSESQEGKILGVAKTIIDNKNELTINKGTYDTVRYSGSNNDFSKAINNTGNLIWEDGNLIVDYGYNYGIYNTGEGTIDWKNGKMHVRLAAYTQYGIYTDSSEAVKWESGEFLMENNGYNCTNYGIYVKGTGITDIKTMIFNNKGSTTMSEYFIYVANNGKQKSEINISDLQRGEITYDYAYGIGGSYAKINIAGGEFSKFTRDDINLYDSEINITGGTFSDRITLGSNCVCTIENANIDNIRNSGGSLTINEGTVIRYLSSNSSVSKTTMNKGTICNELKGNAVEISSGQFTIIDGSIEAKDGYGVYINGGEFTMGDNDFDEGENCIVSTTSPTVTGSTYGVYKNNGKFKFFDGKITGQEKALYGAVNELPINHRVEYNDDNQTVAILGVISEMERIISVDNVYFDNMESAISYAGEKTGDIVIYSEIIVTEKLIVPSDKTITINLNGHTISANMQDSIIENEGNLTIKDVLVEESKEEGEEQVVESKLENTGGYAITNKGTLTIGVKDENITETPNIIGQSKAILNEGKVNWYDGKIDGQQTDTEQDELVNIASLAKQFTIRANNILQETEKTIISLVQTPNIKLDTELPIWTQGPVTATIYTTDRIILDIINDIANVETRSLTVKKVWEMPDEEAQNYKTTIQLMKIVNGKKEPAKDRQGNIYTVEIIGNNSATFENIPVYKGKEKIEYALEEIKVQRKTAEGKWEDVPITDFNVTYKQMTND